MKLTKLTTLISIIILLAACSEDNWFYNGELGDCPWCENGLLEDLRDCPHCDNGILTETQSCSICNHGYIECVWCNGLGGKFGNGTYTSCSICNGQGRKKCSLCNGRGYYFIDKLGNRSPF